MTANLEYLDFFFLSTINKLVSAGGGGLGIPKGIIFRRVMCHPGLLFCSTPNGTGKRREPNRESIDKQKKKKAGEATSTELKSIPPFVLFGMLSILFFVISNAKLATLQQH